MTLVRGRGAGGAFTFGLLLALVSGAPTVFAAPDAESWPKPGRIAALDAGDLEEPPPPIIEAIDIRGNERTDRGIIRRRILLEEGDLLDDRKVEESRLKLLGTGFFSSVEFRLQRGSRRGLVLLVVEVRERNTLVVDQLFLGFSSVSPIFAGAGVAETNFLGKGVTVGGRFAVGDERQAVELRSFVPSLAKTPLQLSASMLATRGAELLNSSDTDGLQLTYERFGGRLGLGFGVGPAQRVSLIYRLEAINTDRLPNLNPSALRGAPSILFDDSLLSTFTLQYEQDNRNDVFVPTDGWSLTLSFEVGTRLLGSDYEFSKYFGQGSVAFEPRPEHSLVLRAAAGLIQGQTPFFNQFFIGDFTYFAAGRDSLPRAVELNFSEHNDYDDLVVGGGAEYAIPVAGGGRFLYRLYLYGGAEAWATASLDEAQEDPTGRGTGGYFPLSFDVGLKMDTYIGSFTLSLAYIFELAI